MGYKGKKGKNRRDAPLTGRPKKIDYVEFDDQARRRFVTGFRARRVGRRRGAVTALERRLRVARVEARAERRDAAKELFARALDDQGKSESDVLPWLAAEAADAAMADGEGDAAEDDGGAEAVTTTTDAESGRRMRVTVGSMDVGARKPFVGGRAKKEAAPEEPSKVPEAVLRQRLKGKHVADRMRQDGATRALHQVELRNMHARGGSARRTRAKTMKKKEGAEESEGKRPKRTTISERRRRSKNA